MSWYRSPKRGELFRVQLQVEMEDAHTIILPPKAAIGDDVGVHQVLDFFVRAASLKWAALEIRVRGSNLGRTVTIGRRSKPSTSIDLEIVGDTTAVLSIAAGTTPPNETLALLTACLDRELHRLRLLAEAALLRGAIEATTAAVIIFGSTGTILFANTPADDLISKQTENELTVVADNGVPQPLFRVICNQVGELLDAEVHRQSVTDRLRISNGAEVTTEFVTLETGAEGLGRVVLAVVREVAGPPDHLVDRYAARYRLSPREREILRLLVRGYDTAGLAMHLGISPHTVRDHLKNVFRKTSNRSRSELIGALTGAGNHGR
jgi:DNA-binding CsgD family transcriptional regulator